MKNKIVIFGLVIVILIGVFSVISYRQYERNEIIQITCEWASLSSFPENAKIISVEKSGSFFTREFRTKFTAPEKDIREWFNNSSGTSSINPEIEGCFEKYSIKPEGGAQFAEVIYNTETNEIFIRVYWS